MNEVVTRTEWEGRAPGCLAPDVLLAYHRNRLSRPQKKEVRRHLRRCPDCARDSAFVAIIVRDEKRLMQEMAALLPGCREIVAPGPSGAHRLSTLRPPRTVVAAAAAAGIILTLFILPPFRKPSPAGPISPAGIATAGPISASPLAERLIPKRKDLRERLISSGLLQGPDLSPPPVVSPGVNLVLASFEISQRAEREDDFYGWSLTPRSETAGSHLAFLPR